jgi:tRNA dimethylallyltransferase
MRKFLVSICGATGIGKTKWAIELARYYNTEVLSADSRQFYREMQIGTAVPSPEELEAVPHSFIQHKSVKERYSAGDYQQDALKLISEKFRTKDLLVLVGGSGLFLDAITKGLDIFPEVAPGVRESLEIQYAAEGIQVLQKQLLLLDPAYYQSVDIENPRRLIRALEVCISSGTPFSDYLGKRKSPEGFIQIPLGIDAPRDVIYRRIEERVDQMIAQGLLEEVTGLLPYRELNALQTVGYQELFAYLDGHTDFETAVENIKRNTRRFAKRQATWFRKDSEIQWIPFDAPLETAIAYIDNQIQNFNAG